MSHQKDLNKYFKEAKSWADDNFGRVERSRNRYQVAFMTAMGLNVAAIIAVSILSHYQTIVPMLVHHYSNGVTTVEPIDEKKAVINRTQIESDIVRYVMHREAYEPSSYRTQFDLVNLLSNDTVQNEYLREQDKANPESPITTLGTNLKREVHLYSINFIDSLLNNENDIHKNHQNLAEVVFTLKDTDKQSGKTTETHYNALLSWRYTNPPDSPELRWKNWDGFEVTRYSKERRVEHTA